MNVVESFDQVQHRTKSLNQHQFRVLCVLEISMSISMIWNLADLE